MATFAERVVGAVKLDAAIYEEIEADTGALGQAVTVILASAIAAGIGALGHEGPGLLLEAVGSLVGWVLWAAITWLVGTRVLPGPQTEADLGQLLRTLGFAAAPGAFAIFRILPVVGDPIAIAAHLWQLAAMVVAVRQALDYESTGRAIAVCAIGFLAFAAIVLLLR